jgi:hypothetical protein
MRLNKLDLSKILAISHDDDCLGLVIDRGDSLEVIEIPAPRAAYEGLQLLNAIVTDDCPGLSASVDFNQLPGTEQEIAMLPVESNMANAVGYDTESQLLQVEFKNGSVYQYEEVDEETWEAMKTADSTGQFFNCNIKGNYPSRRID